jgi:DNA polymerase-3 subunit alpha
MTGFAHLRVHSEYSLVDGTIRIAELMDQAVKQRLPAVGVTDEGNLFACVKAYAAAEARGIKPIVGVDLALESGAEGERDAEPSRITLLAMDRRGYRDLCALVTRSFREGHRRERPVVRREWIAERASRLIALSGGGAGDVGRALLAGRADQARAQLDAWRAIFGDRYCIEVWRTGRRDDEPHLQAALELAARAGVPAVATNDVRFLARDDFDAHEARVCIHQGRTLDDARRPRRYSDQQYLRSPAEMQLLFADHPELLANTLEVARRCNVELEIGKPHLPRFPLPEGRSAEAELAEQAALGLKARLADVGEPPKPVADYDARLATEVEMISRMGFAGYYLIVADFTRWARSNGVPVGPGRGSGAGSLAAWALGITDLDPLRYDLLFERFLNPERVSLPDFDIDFCVLGRDRVIDYVAGRYGRDQVSQIITYGSMAARAVLRDVGRVLGHPYGFADGIAKLIPVKQGIVASLDEALEQEPQLRARHDQEEEVRALIDLARKLEGLARNAGKHAGGVVIAPEPLTDFTALYSEQGGDQAVTQLDMEDCEKVGLVKFDFLGLTTVTIIDRAVALINARRAERELPAIDLEHVALDDPATYALLRRADTAAVFQLESRGMKSLLRKLQPDRFDDIIAVNALFRPGPLGSGMVDEFIERKHGKRRVEFPHPDLERILGPTYGVMVYQEQVMQTAQVLAGYTLGGADMLRRAMGKKKAEEMAQQRAGFLAGAKARGVNERKASEIFDTMEKFAEYGFNKSHAAAYALLAYRTAWLKTHFPAEFMAAVLSLAMGNTDSSAPLVEACRAMGLEVLPPDVNRSEHGFTVPGDRAIRYGLGAIRGVGESAIAALSAERRRGGPFKDLDELCRRIDQQKINKRVLEALVRAGACDALGPNRASLFAHLPKAAAAGEQTQRAVAVGQNDMFGLYATGDAKEGGSGAGAMAPMAALPDWDDRERLAGEKATLGLYLSGHPMERYVDDVDALASARIGDLTAEEPAAVADPSERFRQPARNVTVVGLVHELRRRPGRTSLVLDDRSDRIEVTLFEEQAQQFKHLLAEDAVLVIEGRMSFDDYGANWRISAKSLRTLEDARAKALKRVVLAWPAGAGPAAVERLKALLEPFRGGGCGLTLDYGADSGRGEVALPDAWRVHPTDELLDRLRAFSGQPLKHVWRTSS